MGLRTGVFQFLTEDDVLPGRDGDTSYSLRVAKGDFVRLPDGRTGTVVRIELLYGCNAARAVVQVDKAKRRWFGLLPACPDVFIDGAIDRLELICTKEELECLGV